MQGVLTIKNNFMKKIKLNGKLSLNKETIAKLNDEQMNSVKGGAGSSLTKCGYNCPTHRGYSCETSRCDVTKTGVA